MHWYILSFRVVVGCVQEQKLLYFGSGATSFPYFRSGCDSGSVLIIKNYANYMQIFLVFLRHS